MGREGNSKDMGMLGMNRRQMGNLHGLSMAGVHPTITAVKLSESRTHSATGIRGADGQSLIRMHSKDSCMIGIG